MIYVLDFINNNVLFITIFVSLYLNKHTMDKVKLETIDQPTNYYQRQNIFKIIILYIFKIYYKIIQLYSNNSRINKINI